MTFWKERFEQFGEPKIEQYGLSDEGLHETPWAQVNSSDALLFLACTGRRLTGTTSDSFRALVPLLAQIAPKEATAMSARLCAAVGSSDAALWGVVASMIALRAQEKRFGDEVETLRETIGLTDRELRDLYVAIQIPVAVAEARSCPKRPESFSPNTYPFEYDES